MSRYKAYPEYKESGVIGLDRLPFDWSVKKVKHIFNIGRGRVISQEELIDDGEFPVYSSQTANDGCLGFISTFDFDCDQLTWTTDGANAGTIFLRGGKHNCTNVCGTLQPIKSTVLLKFFSYSLQYVAQFYKRPDTNGAKIMNGEMAEILVSFPSDIEQQKIANFLDHETAKIDTLIAKQQELIKLLKEKRQAVISHAVTKGLNPNAPMRDSGVEWLGDVPAHWGVLPLKHLASLVGTGGTPKVESSFSEEPEVNWFTPGDFGESISLSTSAKYVTSLCCENGDAKLYPANSVLIIGIGATLGKVGYCTKSFSCNQQINIVTPNNRIDAVFLANTLGTQVTQMRQLSNFSTIGIMNQEKTKQILVAIPPIVEQHEINEWLEKQNLRFGSLLESAANQVELLHERRTALISAAVTGKIDVRDWQPPIESAIAA